MKETYYNVHDIIKFKIVEPSFTLRFKFNNIHGSYKNFESTKSDDLDFVVFLGQFHPSNHKCNILEGKYYIRDNYIYCKEDSYKLAKWKFEISGLDDKGTLVRISSNFLGYMWMSGFIIEFLIHYKLNQKGYPIIHASCISTDNNGSLFSARGGGGKTTIAMHFLEKGFKLLGDNFVILDKGQVLSYLSPLNIFTYNLSPIIQRNLGFYDGIILTLKDLFYKATFGYIKIFTKMNPKDVFPHLVRESTMLSILLFIVAKEDLKIEKINKKELCNYLITNQQLDTLFFMEYIYEYSYVFPNSELSQYWSKYKENLNKNLPDNLIYYRIEVPQKYDKNVLEAITDLIICKGQTK